MKRTRKAPTNTRVTKKSKTTAFQKPQITIRTVTERKYFDTQRAGLNLSQSTTTWAGAEIDPATLNCLFAPLQGDDFNNRQGRKVHVLSIKIQGQIGIPSQTDATAPDNGTIIRLHLVQDKQTNGAQLNAEDVFTSGDASEPLNMFQNPAFFGRFSVLKTKKFALMNPNFTYDGTNIEQQGLTKIFKINHEFKKPVVVHYNATNGGTVADCVDNSFHMIGMCNNNGLAPAIAYKVRTTFVDI